MFPCSRSWCSARTPLIGGNVRLGLEVESWKLSGKSGPLALFHVVEQLEDAGVVLLPGVREGVAGVAAGRGEVEGRARGDERSADHRDGGRGSRWAARRLPGPPGVVV